MHDDQCMGCGMFHPHCFCRELEMDRAFDDYIYTLSLDEKAQQLMDSMPKEET